MEKPRHFPLRHDLWDHPRTSWMYPDDLAVFALISSASILGVCTYSEKKIAKKTKVHLDKVPMVLHALQDHGIVKWWPDDEIAWSIERADEACVGGNALVGAQREWREYPVHVQDAIADRYPRLRASMGSNPPGTIKDSPLTQPPSEGGTTAPPVTVTVMDPVTVTVSAFREAWYARLCAIKADLGPTNDPTRDPQAYAGLCEALTQHGHDLVLAVTEWAVRKEPTGKLTATMFRGAGFGAHLDAYVASQKAERGRAMVAPHKLEGRVLTDAEQREWVKAASGGSDPETALRAAWAAEEQLANDLAKELWPV